MVEVAAHRPKTNNDHTAMRELFRTLWNCDPAEHRSLGPELLAALEPASGAITPEAALRCPAVLAAVRIVSEAVAQLPLHCYRRGADGGRERSDDHPLARLTI